jgi:hypothetical protein
LFIAIRILSPGDPNTEPHRPPSSLFSGRCSTPVPPRRCEEPRGAPRHHQPRLPFRRLPRLLEQAATTTGFPSSRRSSAA